MEQPVVVAINDYANLRIGALTADDESTFTQGLTSAGDIILSGTTSILLMWVRKLIINSSSGSVNESINIDGQNINNVNTNSIYVRRNFKHRFTTCITQLVLHLQVQAVEH